MEAATVLTGPNHRSLEDQAFTRADTLADTTPGSILYITRFDARAPIVADRWANEYQSLRLRTENLKGVVNTCYETLVGPSATLSGALNRRLVEYALDRIADHSAHRFEDPPVSTPLADAFETRFSLFGDVGLTAPEALEDELASTSLNERIIDTVTNAYAAYHDLRETYAPNWLHTSGEAFRKVATSDEPLDVLLPNVDAVIISGYYEFRPVERAMLERLVESFPTIALVPQHTNGECGVDAAVTDALTTYEEVGFSLEHISPGYGSDDLQRVSAALYQSEPHDTEVDVNSLSWRKLPTPEREIRFVARDVKQELATGTSPNDIAIVVPSLDEYRKYVTESLEANGVSYSMKTPEPLQRTLVGNAVEHLLELAEEEPRADDLTTLLSNPLVTHISQGQSDKITAIARRRDTVSLDQLCADLTSELREPVDSLRADIAAIQTSNLTNAVATIRDLLDDLGIPQAVESYANKDARQLEQRALSMVEEVLASCETMAYVSTEVTSLDLLRRSFNGVPVRSPRRQKTECVEVLGFLDAQMRALDQVYLVGLTADNFPTSAERPSFFEKMTDAHPMLDPGDEREQARYLFATMLANSNSVTITTPSAEKNDSAVIRSPVLDELQRVTNLEPESGIDNRIASREDLQRAIASRDDRREILETAGTRGDFSPEQAVRADRGISCAVNRRQNGLTPHDGVLTADTIETVYPESDREPYSASRIERYVSCGYRFYMEHVLGIEALDDMERTPTPLETGRFVHNVLEGFYAGLKDTSTDTINLNTYDQEWLESHILDVAREELVTSDFQYTGLFYRRWCEELFAGLGTADTNPHFGDERPHHAVDQGLFARFLKKELDTDGETRPIWFEQPFGEGLPEGGDQPPFTVDLPNDETIAIRGYIDRADVNTGEESVDLSLYDYKTGSTPSMTTVTGGTKFQLPIYLLAAKAVLADTIDTFGDLSATYYRVKPPNDLHIPGGLESKFDSQAELQRFLDDVVPDRLEAVSRGISNGRFYTTVLPEQEAKCTYCDYRDICDVRNHWKHDRIETLQADEQSYVPQRVQNESFADVFGGEGDA